jgi:hypothetical protein
MTWNENSKKWKAFHVMERHGIAWKKRHGITWHRK